MKKTLVAALIAGSFISVEARAQGRAGSAALGAVSGAVVLGPVGAVAGAVIGYAAGPEIARSWRASRNVPRRARTAKRPAQIAARQTKQRPSAPPPGEITPAPGAGGPPVQGLE